MYGAVGQYDPGSPVILVFPTLFVKKLGLQTKRSDRQSGLYGHRTKQMEGKHKHIHAKSVMEPTTPVDDSVQQYKNL
jgi:hypothetical protein